MRGVPMLALSALALLALAAGTAQADSVSDAENLVRQVYYEGMPLDAAEALDARAVARLGTMLRDPAEAEHHGNIVLALGMSGHAHAFALLARYADRAPSGEVDRNTFRARTRIAQAMGHLARADRRALAWLLARADEPAGPPDWSFRHFAGDSLALLLDEQILTGLALSGADEADASLRRVEQEVTGSDVAARRLRSHAANARREHQRWKQDADATRGGSQR
jgi:hypothetical protein